MEIGECAPSAAGAPGEGCRPGNPGVMASKGGVCLKIRLTHGMGGRAINIMSQGRGREQPPSVFSKSPFRELIFGTGLEAGRQTNNPPSISGDPAL